LHGLLWPEQPLHWPKMCTSTGYDPEFSGGENMLWTIVVLLLIAWLLGLVGVYQIGSIIWLFLAAAIIVLLLQFITGRRPIA
jgi:Family of unknown function (DUF5670)